MEGTRLAELYRAGLYTPPTLSEFATACAKCVGHLSPDMTVHRLTGDCPRELLIAPDWNADKNAVIKRINDEMSRLGIKQGSLRDTV